MSMAEDTRYRSDYPREPAQDDGHAPADPLAELARLIGQSDPFSDLRGRRASVSPSADHDPRPAPEWLARATSRLEQDGYADTPYPASYNAPYSAQSSEYRPEDYAPSDDHYRAPADPYAQEQHADPAYAEDAYQGAESDPVADDRYRVAPPASDYDADGYYDDGHLPPRGDDDGLLTGRRRGGLVTIAAVLGLALVGTAGAFGYRAFTGGSGDATPPIIKADPTPAKIMAAAPPADANKPIQDRVGAATPVQTERIVPREEPPVAVPVAPQQQAAPAPVAPFGAVAPAPPSPNEPKRVRTMTIRQDMSTDTARPAGTPQAAAPAPTPAPRAATPKQQKGTPLALAPQAEPAPQRRPTATTDGAYAVQVSAQKTESDAQASYRALQAKYPAVLGSREASIRRADLGDKGVYYRAQIGPFATADQANEFCTNLKSAGGQCIVQKN